MVDNGLLREIAELRGIAKELYGSADEADHTEGIFQAIGTSRAGSQVSEPDP
jgi:tRNA dimethylallyltransferase